MGKTVEKCPACLVVVTESDHDPTCQNRPLTKPEVDRLFAQRKRRITVHTEKGRQVIDAPLISIGSNLLTVVDNHELRVPVEAVLEELAALCDMANANRSVPTDKGLPSPSYTAPIPRFDPAAAQRQLTAAAQRLRDEFEKLAGATRSPHRPAEPQCEECGRRTRITDVYCGPCGARILKEHRRRTEKETSNGRKT
jgi:hypothetical protein